MDQSLVDNSVMDKVRVDSRNLAITLYNYQKVYNMFRYDWMKKVFRWEGIPKKFLKIIKALIEGSEK